MSEEIEEIRRKREALAQSTRDFLLAGSGSHGDKLRQMELAEEHDFAVLFAEIDRLRRELAKFQPCEFDEWEQATNCEGYEGRHRKATVYHYIKTEEGE